MSETNIMNDASEAVDIFIYHHRAAAIPALIGACVLWAVENGGTELIKSTLENSIRLADEMETAKRGMMDS